jgi:hypothetical protein
MNQISRIGLDRSKAVFTLHCVDQAGHPVLRVNVRRAQLIPFSASVRRPRSRWRRAPARITGRGR